MSTLWTPDGERPIRQQPQGPASPYTPGGPPPSAAGAAQAAPAADTGGAEAGELPLSDDERAFLAQMAERQRQLAEAPGDVVVAQGAFLLVELAAVKLG
ncbi:MAG TPA: hypothetical protein VFP61_12640, partial [Acidimicrobiales bacterium]|nr:hypothetical protein [Acidimicrobiales bacterium]